MMRPGIEDVVNRHNAAAAERSRGSPGSAHTDEWQIVVCGITEKYRLSMSFDYNFPNPFELYTKKLSNLDGMPLCRIVAF